MRFMQILFYSILVLFFSSGNGFCENASAPIDKNSKPLIELFNLSEMPYQITGCSCSFYADSATDGLVFASDAGKKVWMKIDGKLALLTLKESKFGRDVGSIGTKKIGSKLNFIYSGDDLLVTIELEATSVCPPNAEECEGQKFNATFTAQKGNRQHTVKAKGSCGC